MGYNMDSCKKKPIISHAYNFTDSFAEIEITAHESQKKARATRIIPGCL